MGNDNSKQTIENQQMILQLQNQLLKQQQYYHNPTKYSTPQLQNQYVNVVKSPAELQQRQTHPTFQNIESSNTSNTSNTIKTRMTLLDILNNPDMMSEIDKNPTRKRKFLERLLQEHRHIMTTNQVNKINYILNKLPPAEVNYISKSQGHQHASNNNNNSNLNGNMNGNTNGIGFNMGTTRQDNISRELEKTQQNRTIEDLTKHYRTEAEREEMEFKLEEERRKKEFEEKQRQRRNVYNMNLNELETNNIDALQLFGLQANYTIDELKKSFKKLALKHHPDKPTGNEDQFQLITKCFMLLLEKYNSRESNKQFTDLKNASKNYIEDNKNNIHLNNVFYSQSMNTSTSENATHSNNINKNTNTSKNTKGDYIDKDKFNIKLFNKIYEENKLWDSNDDGYGDWFSSNKKEEPPSDIFSKKFNINVFNSTFEDYKNKLNGQSGAIQEYKEPQELISCSTGFTDLTLSAKGIEDFSKPLPVGKSAKELAFTDLKTAYSSRGAFIDPNKVEYKTYKNVEELKRDRGNIRYDMTPDEMRIYELKKRQEQEEEEQRRYLLQQRDNVVTNSYNKLHEKMLGYIAKPPA